MLPGSWGSICCHGANVHVAKVTSFDITHPALQDHMPLSPAALPFGTHLLLVHVPSGLVCLPLITWYLLCPPAKLTSTVSVFDQSL
jgi:hypothetical protein